MSWSFDFEAQNAEAIMGAGNAAMKDYFERLNDVPEAIEVMREQAVEAIGAAALVARVVGKRGLKISLSGHGNPNHEPRLGWADEIITVRVSEVS